jgi:hypothetical protein
MNFIMCLAEMIRRQLPAKYDARTDERVYLTDREEDREVQVKPDVTVERWDDLVQPSGELRSPVGAGAVIEPVTLRLVLMDPMRDHFIEVRKLPTREVIAVVEVLSPWNKTGRGRVEYLDKRHEILCSKAHLIELDLLLAGRRLPVKGRLPPGDYFGFVSRGDRRPNCDVYAWSLRQTLPAIPIPLRSPHADIQIDLAAVFSSTYERAGYAPILPYQESPPVKISPNDVEWVCRMAALAAP